MVPPATVANAEKSKPQLPKHKQGHEENHHRYQDCCRQEDFGKETGHQKAARQQEKPSFGSR